MIFKQIQNEFDLAVDIGFLKDAFYSGFDGVNGEVQTICNLFFRFAVYDKFNDFNFSVSKNIHRTLLKIIYKGIICGKLPEISIYFPIYKSTQKFTNAPDKTIDFIEF